MNLPSSVVVTSFIVAVVWFAVVYQPGQAWAYQGGGSDTAQYDPADENPQAATKPADHSNTKVSELKSIDGFKLEGVSGTINISAIDQLWLDFGSRYDLHNRLTEMRVSSYVLYSNLSEDYARADITIGYSQADIRGAAEVSGEVPAGRYDTLLAAGRHSQGTIASAWSDIDHGREIEAILEEHSVNTSGEVVASAIYVLYR